jgi:hypothetical protein
MNTHRTHRSEKPGGIYLDGWRLLKAHIVWRVSEFVLALLMLLPPYPIRRKEPKRKTVASAEDDDGIPF